jgi:polyhydroxyalkanoate synthase subunit PhaC
MARWGFAPFAVDAYDNPETIRMRKYVTGAHFVLRGTGIETGRTPREVVWEKGKARLYRYGTGVEKRFAVPVLLVYALILRPYIMDLVPGNSFVEYLVDEGFDVYLLDWGVPGGEDSDLSFEDYVLDYMPELEERVLETSGAGGLTLFGYCQGGTMSAIYAALSPGAPPTNLVLLTTPTDFAPDNPGLLGLWTYWSRQGYFDPDLLVGLSGNVPADAAHRFVEGVAGTPLGGYFDAFANPWGVLARGRPTKSFLAVSKWVDDGVPFPGAAFRQWVRDFYQQNKLVAGELELRGHRVDLSEIRCPVLNIAGRKDYICPVSQAEATMDLVGSEDKEFLVLDAGHVGLMCSPVAKNELWPRVRDWLEPRSN